MSFCKNIIRKRENKFKMSDVKHKMIYYVQFIKKIYIGNDILAQVPHTSLSEEHLNLKLGFCDQLERDAGGFGGNCFQTS